MRLRPEEEPTKFNRRKKGEILSPLLILTSPDQLRVIRPGLQLLFYAVRGSGHFAALGRETTGVGLLVLRNFNLAHQIANAQVNGGAAVFVDAKFALCRKLRGIKGNKLTITSRDDIPCFVYDQVALTDMLLAGGVIKAAW
jgi:hypothetical protein